MNEQRIIYDELLKEFARKHGIVNILTSSIENDRYSKTYIGNDNAEFFEVCGSEYVKQEIEVKRIKVEVEVKLFKVEFWSTDDSHSRFYYEQY